MARAVFESGMDGFSDGGAAVDLPDWVVNPLFFFYF